MIVLYVDNVCKKIGNFKSNIDNKNHDQVKYIYFKKVKYLNILFTRVI